MTTTTAPVTVGTAHRPARRPAYGLAGTDIPRTSTTKPWDRVRFSGPAGRASEAAPAEPPAEPLPEPGQWAGALVRSAVEALTGVRPAAQLARWLSADLYDSLARRAGLAVRVLGRPSPARRAMVRRVHVCQISPCVAEASVVVHDGERLRAAAVRLEVHRGRWRATALEIG